MGKLIASPSFGINSASSAKLRAVNVEIMAPIIRKSEARTCHARGYTCDYEDTRSDDSANPMANASNNPRVLFSSAIALPVFNTFHQLLTFRKCSGYANRIGF